MQIKLKYKYYTGWLKRNVHPTPPPPTINLHHPLTFYFCKCIHLVYVNIFWGPGLHCFNNERFKILPTGGGDLGNPSKTS